MLPQKYGCLGVIVIPLTRLITTSGVRRDGGFHIILSRQDRSIRVPDLQAKASSPFICTVAAARLQ